MVKFFCDKCEEEYMGAEHPSSITWVFLSRKAPGSNSGMFCSLSCMADFLGFAVVDGG